MPHVIDDTDIEEYSSPTAEYDALYERSRVVPSRRGRSRFLAFLRRLFTPVPRLKPRRKVCCIPGAPRFETALDVLAREHPDIHLRLMAGMG